jgi:cardiolipin synthase
LDVVHADEAERRLGEPMLQGNKAQVFEQSAVGQKVLLDIVESATNHINLDAALLHAPGLGAKLLACLVEQFRKGVRLQVLAHAPKPGRPSVELSILRDAGATVNEIRPPRGPIGWVERRFSVLQRQLMVVDGQVAWCGPGVRTADLCTRGPHVCLQGPVVQRLQRMFLETWHASGSHTRLPPANFFPPMTTSGSLRMGISLSSHPASPHPLDRCALIGAIERARFHVFICMAQRVPSRELVRAVSSAATRGVNVSVLLQGSPSLNRRWHRCCSELLRSRTWVYQGDSSLPFPPHCIVDGVWSCLALDANTGWQSARVGDASSLIILGAEFAEALDAACQGTVARAALLDAHALAEPRTLQHLVRTTTRVHGWLGSPADHSGSDPR